MEVQISKIPKWAPLRRKCTSCGKRRRIIVISFHPDSPILPFRAANHTPSLDHLGPVRGFNNEVVDAIY